MTQVKHSRGGMLRHLVAAPSGIAIGALIASLDWDLSKAPWLRGEKYSNADQVSDVASPCHSRCQKRWRSLLGWSFSAKQ